MAQGRSTEIISMIKGIRTSRLSIKNSLSLSLCVCVTALGEWQAMAQGSVHLLGILMTLGAILCVCSEEGS